MTNSEEEKIRLFLRKKLGENKKAIEQAFHDILVFGVPVRPEEILEDFDA